MAGETSGRIPNAEDESGAAEFAPDSPSSDLSENAIPTLVRLRWGLIVLELLAVIFTASAVAQQVAFVPVAVSIAFQILTNVTVGLLSRRPSVVTVRRTLIASLLVLDIACLAAVIHWSGGPANPFSSLFVIHAIVAVVVLPPRYSSALAAAACGGYLAVFLLATGGSLNPAALERIGHGMHQAIPGHLLGMWLSLTLTVAAVTAFGGQMLRQLGAKERALARARADTFEAKRVASLTSFAAGAAHELSTPLLTIAVVVGELSRRNLGGDEATNQDLGLIRSEVGRCQRIIQSMRFDLDRTSGPGRRPFDQELREELAVLLGEATLSRADFEFDLKGPVDDVPVRGIAHALAALVRNAVEASGATQRVAVRVTGGADRLVLVVSDQGRGISAEDLPRIQEPFFSRRPDGEGLGLGLFLARVICDQIHASLTIRSQIERGTVATIDVPRFPRKLGAGA